eukprot:2349725-Amphidinium_carterae.1
MIILHTNEARCYGAASAYHTRVVHSGPDPVYAQARWQAMLKSLLGHRASMQHGVRSSQGFATPIVMMPPSMTPSGSPSSCTGRRAKIGGSSSSQSWSTTLVRSRQSLF